MTSKSNAFDRKKEERMQKQAQPQSGFTAALPKDVLSELAAMGSAKSDVLSVISSKEIRVGAFVWTTIGLRVDGEIKREDWEETGRVLRKIEVSLQWILGDWANVYVAPDMNQFEASAVYSEIATDFGLNKKTLQNYASVCRALDASLRREALGFSVHREIAEMPEALKGNEEYFLAWAEREKATVAQLKEHILEKLAEVLGGGVLDKNISDLFSKGHLPKFGGVFQTRWTKARNGDQNAKGLVLEEIAKLRKWADEIEESLED